MKSCKSFTLVELLLVIACMGILCGMVIPAFHQFLPGVRLDSATRVLAEDLRLARSYAVTTMRPHGLVFDTQGDSYHVYDNVVTSFAQDPLTKKSLKRDYSSDGRFRGVDILQAVFPKGTQVEFNSLGSPDGGGTVTLGFGAMRKTVSVEAGTGKVTITGG